MHPSANAFHQAPPEAGLPLTAALFGASGAVSAGRSGLAGAAGLRFAVTDSGMSNTRSPGSSRAGGSSGTDHGCDYKIADPEMACVNSAKWQLIMLRMLLENGATRAKKVIEEYTPVFDSKEAFLAFQDSLNSSGDRIAYSENNIAEIRL